MSFLIIWIHMYCMMTFYIGRDHFIVNAITYWPDLLYIISRKHPRFARLKTSTFKPSILTSFCYRVVVSLFQFYFILFLRFVVIQGHKSTISKVNWNKCRVTGLVSTEDFIMLRPFLGKFDVFIWEIVSFKVNRAILTTLWFWLLVGWKCPVPASKEAVDPWRE